MRRFGFTGTRFGISDRQINTIESLLVVQPFEAHHGDCVGADAQLHALSRLLGARVVVHPPINDAHRALCVGDEARAPLPYMRRNKNIVDACDELIAAPLESAEQERGGTWRTVQLARKAKKRLTIVWPDGTISIEVGST